VKVLVEQVVTGTNMSKWASSISWAMLTGHLNESNHILGVHPGPTSADTVYLVEAMGARFGKG